MDELLARLRAALRRAAPAEEEAVVVTADFTIDLAAKRVTDARRRRDPADADGVAHRRGARAPRGEARRAEAAAAGGVGPGRTRPRRTTCASSWPRCAASSSPSRGGRATSSPSPAWATGSKPGRLVLDRLVQALGLRFGFRGGERVRLGLAPVAHHLDHRGEHRDEDDRPR